MSLPPVPAPLLVRVQNLLKRGQRQLLGLAGAPGSGKSSLAAALAAVFPEQVVVVPMDGFHLANAELQRLGRHARKGAPDTFDSAGFVALLRRLKHPVPGETVYAAQFQRSLEESVAGAIAVPSNTPLVITEGNYLLLAQGPWVAVRDLLDEAWYLSGDDSLRLARLQQRHEQFGRTAEAARAWIASTDEPNARLIETSRHRADLHVHW